MCWEAAETLPCEASAPEQARRFVVRALSSVTKGDGPVPVQWRTLTEDAELVVSELTTNALRAACHQLHLSLELHHAELVVSVRDDAGGWPHPRYAAPTDPSGRGLQLVGAISERWGVTPTDGGKAVWAALTVPQECRDVVDCHR